MSGQSQSEFISHASGPTVVDVKEIPQPLPTRDSTWDQAIHLVGMWHRAALVQVDRVRMYVGEPESDHSGQPQELVEFCYLATALANLDRALERYAEVAAHRIGKGAGSRLRRNAVECIQVAHVRLNNEVPDLRDMRDVLSHLEDYSYGLGRRQTSGQPIQFRNRHGGAVLVVEDADRTLHLDLDLAEEALDKVAGLLIDAMVDWID
jgi:hypothetical protein